MSQVKSFAAAVSLKKAAEQHGSRLHGLDWLRAVAALLVVMLHAAIPYMTHPLPGLKWSIVPAETSQTVNTIGWGIDGFIMPIFFLMNGYLAARLLAQRGTSGFLKHRLKRIGGPFLFAAVVILPMDLYIWLLGWVNAGIIPVKTFRTIKIGGELGNSLHGVSHLWFLEYVLVYCCTACLLQWFISRWQKSQTHASAVLLPLSSQKPSWIPLVIGIAVAGTMLFFQPRIVIGFRHGWVPFWENLIFYAVPFALGWFWDRHSPRAIPQGPRWGIQLSLAAMAAVLMWPDLLNHLEHETIPVAKARLPFLFATYSVLMSTGLFGVSLSKGILQAPAAVSYLSKASFWIYLFHHPMVALVQVTLALYALPALAKFLISTSISVLMCLLTYEVLVRRTWVGELLNGVRDLPRVHVSAPVEQPAAVKKSAA